MLLLCLYTHLHIHTPNRACIYMYNQGSMVTHEASVVKLVTLTDPFE